MDRDEAEMTTDNPAPISFKKLKTTKSDTSGVGKVCSLHILCMVFLAGTLQTLTLPKPVYRITTQLA